MTPGLSFIILALVIAVCAWWGIRRYRTPLNPLTVFAIIEMGIGQLFSGIVVYYVVRTYEPWTATKYPDKFIVYTALLACVYAAGSTVPYLFRQRILVTYYGRLLRVLGLASDTLGTVFVRWKYAFLFAGAAISFIGLAVVGGGGIEWLINPRHAYGTSREAANPFYAATQWFLIFAFLYYLWSRRPRGLRLIGATLAFSLLAAWLASKGYIMINVFVAAAYYHFRVKPIPTWLQIAAVPIGIAASLVLITVQGTIDNLAESIIYYQDYFDSTAWFLSRFNEFGFRYGGVALSFLWFFVPRGLYPDKPYYWGYLYVNQMLFPGLAEQGITPASLPWTTFYMDFGVVGVFFGGLFSSIVRQVVYEYYLAHRGQLFPFIIAMHIGLLSIFTLAPLPIALILVILQSIFLRLVLRAGAAPAAGAQPAPSVP